MQQWMGKDFLLGTDTARYLYHKAAADQPIFDYHCHLSPAQIAANHQAPDLADLWLGGDHYKWRQMRTAGIAERYITGDAAPYDKFLAWAHTLERLIGNPLYHWSHLELQRFFGINEPLTVKSAPSIWKKANATLASGELTVAEIFRKMNVYAVGTTDDPIDDLAVHAAIASGSAAIGKIATRVIPSFRPDKAIAVDQPGYPEYAAKLSRASGLPIKTVADLVAALENRLDYFVAHGCRAADHGLNYAPWQVASEAECDDTLARALAGERVSKESGDALRTRVLAALGAAYAKRGIVMQYHVSVTRNNNARALSALGPDTGFDASGDCSVAQEISGLFSLMEDMGGIPKTILYSLNPKDYYPLATLMGCFQGPYLDASSARDAQGASDAFLASVPGKIQLGSAWWFCDHRDGMEEQLRALASLGMLPAFVGMLTDSRSFLSYTRHEYFRRILCNLVGSWVENGEYPNDRATLAAMIRDISFGNAARYFN